MKIVIRAKITLCEVHSPLCKDEQWIDKINQALSCEGDCEIWSTEREE